MHPKRLLITGASGFAGHWCLHGARQAPNWHAVAASDRMDLRDPASIDAELAGPVPDAVLHLAAQSFVPASFDDPRGTFEINLLGTLNLLQALARRGFSGRFLYVSSADVYGQVPEARMPITEETPPDPRNPYAVSKTATELLCRQWHHTQGLDVVVARPFNHIGPRQDARFVISGLARQFARIALGRQPPTITAGDMDVSRDFTDVRDVVRAYFALLERGQRGGLYNICSGRAVRLREAFDHLCEIAGVRPDLVVDPARLRAGEQKTACGSAERLRRDTGWQPALTLQASLGDAFAHWTRKIEDDEQD